MWAQRQPSFKECPISPDWTVKDATEYHMTWRLINKGQAERYIVYKSDQMYNDPDQWGKCGQLN